MAILIPKQQVFALLFVITIKAIYYYILNRYTAIIKMTAKIRN